MKRIIIVVTLVFICTRIFSQTIEYKTKTITDTVPACRLSIKADYPQLINYKDVTTQNKINTLIQDEIRSIIDTFVYNIKDYDYSSVSDEFTSEFETGFDVYYSQGNIFSFTYEIYEYVAGAAHPYSYSKSVNFDLTKMKRLGLSDFFKRGEKDLKKVSDFCYKDLTRQGKENGYDFEQEAFKEGLDPTSENFENICITPDGLYIIFNPYQVLAYVFGQQTVTIPYSDLKSIINPDGPLNIFIK